MNRPMFVRSLLALAAASAAALFPAAGLLSAPAFAADSAHPTVVELFQSQGCSSCPPAAANVLAVSDRPDVLALAFEVDYWDRLGWKDTFRAPPGPRANMPTPARWRAMASIRLRWWSTGASKATGSQAGGLASLISRGDRGDAGPAVAFDGRAVTLGAAPAPARPADVLLVRYDPRVVEVAVKRGENAGRTLPHKDVVREVIRLGGWDGRGQSLALPEARSELAEAVIVQTEGAGPILAAARR